MPRLLLIILSMLGMIVAPSVSAAPPPHERQLFLFMFRPGPAWAVGKPMAQQDLKAHASYHAALVRDGKSAAGGGYVGMDGGMAIVRARDLAEAQAMFTADPAIRNGVFTGEVRQWRPRFYSDNPLVEARP